MISRLFPKFLMCTVFICCGLTIEVNAQSPEQVNRANEIYKQVRCPVCATQSLSESDTSLSNNLKDKILNDIRAGRTDAEIIDSLSRTYGDDIRLKPKTEARTVPLWMAPWCVVFFGALGIIGVRRFRRQSNESALDASKK